MKLSQLEQEDVDCDHQSSEHSPEIDEDLGNLIFQL